MSAFAKLFERDGKQVLVTKDETDEGKPCLTFRCSTDVSDHNITTQVSFKKDAKLDAWEVMDRAFDNVNEDQAFGLRNGLPGISM